MRTTIAMVATSAIALTLIPAAAHSAPARSDETVEQKTTAPTSGPDMSKVKAPQLTWAPCEKKRFLLCATALLPLDYSAPDGPKIEIGLTKMAAPEQTTAGRTKKGTVFVNPGGPGASSTQAVMQLGPLLGEKTTAEYDVIGIDPRGIGSSSEARCWSREKKPTPIKGKFPVSAEEQKLHLAQDEYRRIACDKTGRRIIDHMSTAQTARDMEMIRRAIGDKQLNYYGVSYGTYLGATYAALFPNTVGRMTMDSVVDPVAWATGRKGQENRPVTARVGSPEGAKEALDAAFAECKKAGPDRCKHGAVIEKAWTETLEALKKAPVTQGSKTYTYSDFVADTTTAMYRAASYRKLMDSIHQAWQAVTVTKAPPTALKETAQEARKEARKEAVATPLAEQAATEKMDPELKEAAPEKLAVPEKQKPAEGKPVAPGVPVPEDRAWTDAVGADGVMCSDTVNPQNPQDWPKLTTSAEAQKNPFLGYWTWASSGCARWPGKDKNVYRGPFNVKPANPL
ncbi:alpha/beta fold hydrolase, partial [Austwickia chelonae]